MIHRRLGEIRPSFFMPSDIQSPLGIFFLSFFSRKADIECPALFPGFPRFCCSYAIRRKAKPRKINSFQIDAADIQCPVWIPILSIRWSCQRTFKVRSLLQNPPASGRRKVETCRAILRNRRQESRDKNKPILGTGKNNVPNLVVNRHLSVPWEVKGSSLP